MKKIVYVLLTVLLMLLFVACVSEDGPFVSDSGTSGFRENGYTSFDNGTSEVESAAPDLESAASQTVSVSEGTEEGSVMEQNLFYVTVGEDTFTAAFADNSGAEALKELLANGPITIEMNDYGGFEKVGALGQSLPADDTPTNARAGDIVLYQGNQIVVFYGSNSWSYTRLGKINDLTGWEDALGSGNITVTFSLSDPQA